MASFEQTLVVWCAVIPALVAGITWWTARRVGMPAAPGLMASGWWIAIAITMAARQGWQWWPADAWRAALWPLLGWAVLASGPIGWGRTDAHATDADLTRWPDGQTIAWRWMTIGVLSILTAMIAMPTGDAWADTFADHRRWMVLVATSCLINSFALEWLARSGAARWCLWVVVAGLAVPMALAAANYGSLLEFSVGVLVATVVVATLGIWTPRLQLWSVGFAAIAAGAGILAAAQFYSYEEYPSWLFALGLYGPAIVALIDWPLRRRASWLRVIVSATASAAIAGGCIWRVMTG